MLYDSVQREPDAACRTRCASSPPTAPARPAARTSRPSGSRRSATSARFNVRLPADVGGAVPRRGHGGTARRPRLLRLQRDPEQAGARPARHRCDDPRAEPTARSRRPWPPAPCSTTPATCRSSPPGTCAGRSTCPPTAGWPRRWGWCSPTSRSSSSRRTARSRRSRPGSHASASTTWSATCRTRRRTSCRTRTTSPGPAGSAPLPPTTRWRARRSRWSTSATPARSSPGSSPGRATSRSPSSPRAAGELDADQPVLVYCAGGWRSSVGASLLRARGFSDVSDLLGGYGAWDLAHPRAS